MTNLVTAVLVAAGVGGVLLILGRRAFADGNEASADVAAAYGDLASLVMRLQDETTPPTASTLVKPVMRVGAGTKVVEVSWSFDVADDWPSYVAWLSDVGPTGFRRDTAHKDIDVIVFERRSIVNRIETVRIARAGDRRVDVELTVDVEPMQTS